MKYFIMTDNGQSGPYPLEQLVEAGVRPSTYVWCKSMANWQRAEDVPEICRLFRQHLADLNHPSSSENLSELPATLSQNESPNPGFQRGFIRSFQPQEVPDFTDYSSPPMNLIPFSILVALLCFPATGIVALFFAFRSKRLWNNSEQDNLSSEERDSLRHKAHDASRIAKMWIGFSICITIIIAAIAFFH